MKKLKAYEVRDDYEGHCCIRFAPNNATARREGAHELDIEWESVEHCQRKPEFDQYAPGPVPPMVLLEHGWWFECHHCGRRIDDYMADELESDGLDPADFTPCASGRSVYCSAACQAMFYAERRANAAAQTALIELFDAKFPNCKISRVHVCGTKLEGPDDSGGMKCSVSFLFPGARYGATYEYGRDDLYVAQGDLPAYYAWRGKPLPEHLREVA